MHRLLGIGRAVGALGAVALVALAAAGCGQGASRATVQGRIGNLEIVDAFVPAPASPSVAALYLTILNTGASPDRLVGVSSPDATTSMLMTEVGTASAGSMQSLSKVDIPAHGHASLTPGHDHAMLENPTVTLKVGHTVPVTLRFATAGSLTLQVPVVPLTSVTGGTSGGMANMPGM